MKKNTEEEKEGKKRKAKERDVKKKDAGKSKPRDQEDDLESGQWEVVKGGVQAERPKMFQKDQEINTPVVMKKLAEITAVRGKKGTDRKEQIELLVELESVAKEHNLGPAVYIKIGFSIVAAIFDYSLKVHEVQKVQYWISLLAKVNDMLTLAIQSKDNLSVLYYYYCNFLLKSDTLSYQILMLTSSTLHLCYESD